MRSIALKLLSLFILSALLFSLFSCESKKAPKSKTYYGYFDTYVTLYDYSEGTEDDFSDACDVATELLGYYHKLFDIYNEYEGMNNLASINNNAGGEPLEVDSELVAFLLYAREMYDLTFGNVNIAMGSVLSLWHEYRTEGIEHPEHAQLPPRELLAERAEHCDIEKLVVDTTLNTVVLLDPEMSLDVGAIAKGFAVECVADTLVSMGYSSYVLDVGGNIRTIGAKPDGGAWRTGIKNPDIYSSEPYVYYLNVSDVSVVTSGNYQRYYVVDGVNYNHIINKDTLMPAEYFASVTVVTEDSGLADTLSTALFNMEFEEGKELLSSLGYAGAVWVFFDGRVETYGIEKYE